MSEKFITKRPHKKSRAGCLTCKKRKIKCDEAQPSCGFCLQRKLSCSYINVFRSQLPSPPESQIVAKSRSPSTFGEDEYEQSPEFCDVLLTPAAMPILSPMSQIDLRMMHHWSTITSTSIGIGSPAMDNVFKWILPDLAFDSEFLMNGLLGIASLHMQRILPDPGQAQKQTDLYRAKAFRSFREAIPNLDPSTENYQSALLMAVMLVILCSKDQTEPGELTIIKWLVLFRGLSTLLKQTKPEVVMGSRVAPVFTRELTILQTPPAVPTKLVAMLAAIDKSDPDYAGLEVYCQALDVMGMLFASLRDDGLSGPLYVRVVAWSTYLSDDFAGFAQEKRPRALIILSYHLAFLKLVRGVWWVEGLSDPEIDLISQMVGPDLLPYMDIPIQVRNTTDFDEMRALLLQ